jgi:hypothetical protein
MGSSVQQRRSAKTVSDKAQWRGRVRSECLQRVKDQRAGLLWRLRQVNLAFSLFLSIMHPVVCKMQHICGQELAGACREA